MVLPDPAPSAEGLLEERHLTPPEFALGQASSLHTTAQSVQLPQSFLGNSLPREQPGDVLMWAVPTPASGSAQDRVYP